jgi:hypothetical protein
VIELLEIADALKRGRSKRAFAIEGVEDDAFEEVAEGEVMVLGEGLQHLEDTFLHPDAGLDSLDLELVLVDGCSFHMYLCTRVCWYRQWWRGAAICRPTTNSASSWLPEVADRARFYLLAIGDTLRRWRNQRLMADYDRAIRVFGSS